MRPKSSTTPGAQFRRWHRHAGGRFAFHEETIDAGEYSDDTQLTFAVGRARLAGEDWSDFLTRRELPFFQLYQRGAGRAVLRACSAWRKHIAPWSGKDPSDRVAYFGAGANGVAMRALPHVLWNASGKSQDTLFDDVFRDGILTHGHPRALIGAALFAQAARSLFKSTVTLGYGQLIEALLGSSDEWSQPAFSAHTEWIRAYEAAGRSLHTDWAETVEEVHVLLTRAADELARGALADDERVLKALGCFGKTKGSGTITSVASIYLASRYAAQPVGGVIAAAFAFGADTDTLAAMTGGLLGLLHGKEWMPVEWLSVQDAGPLEKLASALVRHDVRTIALRSDASQFDELVDALQRGLPPVVDGEVAGKVVGSERLSHKGKPIADVWKVILEDGQSIHVKKLVSKATGQSTPSDLVRTLGAKPSAKADGNEAPVLRGLRIFARNLARLADFYERILCIAGHRSNNGRHVVGPIELVEQPSDATAAATVILLTAANLEGFITRAVSAGAIRVAVSGDAAEVQWVRFADPEGNQVEAIELPRSTSR